jgi:hypothetical protein
MAEIMMDIRGAFLNGLYAVFSSKTPRATVAVNTIIIAIYQGSLKVIMLNTIK